MRSPILFVIIFLILHLTFVEEVRIMPEKICTTQRNYCTLIGKSEDDQFNILFTNHSHHRFATDDYFADQHFYTIIFVINLPLKCYRKLITKRWNLSNFDEKTFFFINKGTVALTLQKIITIKIYFTCVS